MHLRGNGTPVTHNDLRDRYRSRRERSQHDTDLAFENNQCLDLSVHLPSHRRNNNRFEVLKAKSPPRRRYEEHKDAAYHRRARYNRGSTEGRRRRDARRNQRKLAAARMLDEQLSDDIDRTLSQAGIRKPAPSRARKPTVVLPQTNKAPSQPMIASKIPSEDSWFNFGGLDLIGQQPQFTASMHGPGPATSPMLPPLFPEVPSWCPTIPAFVRDLNKHNESPLFFDLSRLPEPVKLAQSKPRKQELQLWRPHAKPQPLIQSPSLNPFGNLRSSAKTSCRLHISDRGMCDAATQTVESDFCEPPPMAMPITSTDTGFDELSDAYPANLWRILNKPTDKDINDHDRPYIASFTDMSADDEVEEREPLLSTLFTNERTPCELDDTEVPFVHANSLTGLANERAAFSVLDMEDDVITCKDLRTGQELLFRLNELMVDQYMEEGYADAVIAAMDLPPLPPSPALEASSEASSMVVPEALKRSEELDQHANYRREQIFTQPPPPILKLADEDIVDVALLLEATHSPDCWCEGCNDPPEIIDLNVLADAEDDWTDLLTWNRPCSPSLSAA